VSGDLLHACQNCNQPKLLLLPTVKGWLCGPCYWSLGAPAPAPSSRKPHEAEQAIRERMTARGGADAAAVRRGV